MKFDHEEFFFTLGFLVGVGVVFVGWVVLSGGVA